MSYLARRDLVVIALFLASVRCTAKDAVFLKNGGTVSTGG